MISIDDERRVFANAAFGSFVVAVNSVLVLGNGIDVVGCLIAIATIAVATQIDYVDWFFGKWIKGD